MGLRQLSASTISANSPTNRTYRPDQPMQPVVPLAASHYTALHRNTHAVANCRVECGGAATRPQRCDWCGVLDNFDHLGGGSSPQAIDTWRHVCLRNDTCLHVLPRSAIRTRPPTITTRHPERAHPALQLNTRAQRWRWAVVNDSPAPKVGRFASPSRVQSRTTVLLALLVSRP